MTGIDRVTGRWVEVELVPYAPRPRYCRATGVPLARRFWQVGDDEDAVYARPAAERLERRVEELRRMWPEPLRPDTSPASPVDAVPVERLSPGA